MALPHTRGRAILGVDTIHWEVTSLRTLTQTDWARIQWLLWQAAERPTYFYLEDEEIRIVECLDIARAQHNRLLLAR